MKKEEKHKTLYCPECDSEYRDVITECPECNISLITKKEHDKRDKENKFKDWEVVYTAMDKYEAEMVRANISSADIECVILDQKDSSFNLAGELGIIKVLVPKSKIEEALNIVDKTQSLDDEDFDTDLDIDDR